MSPINTITMSVKSACEFLGIGKTSLYEHIRSGSLDVIKLGRRTLVKTDSIVRLVSSKEAM